MAEMPTFTVHYNSAPSPDTVRYLELGEKILGHLKSFESECFAADTELANFAEGFSRDLAKAWIEAANPLLQSHVEFKDTE